MRLIEVDQTEYNLDVLTREGLLELLGMIDAQCINIREQIENASAQYNVHGMPSNYKWLISAKKALRIKGQQRQMIQRRIGELRRNQGRAFSSYFMVAAKQLLDTEKYDEIMNAASHMQIGGKELVAFTSTEDPQD